MERLSKNPNPNTTMNIAKMLKQAQQMQGKMQAAQEELSQRPVEASAGGGKVKVTGTAAGDITGIQIDPAVIAAGDVEMVEDLVLTGVRSCLDEGRRVMAEEMKKITGGLGLPPGMGF
jgi:DNA-binding YbaB/EbfC family protein